MKHFIREHETAAELALAEPGTLSRFRAYHERQVGYLQAERLAHLLVLLAFGVFSLAAFVIYLARPQLWSLVLLVLLLALLVPYIFHYALLENSVQRWYKLSRRMDRDLGRLPSSSSAGRWG
ncbi:MAG: hypothetical protein ABIJ09_21340 [Pseudomonadota bacterium]